MAGNLMGDGRHVVMIPQWAAAAILGAICTVIIGYAVWANTMSTKMSAVQEQVRSTNELQRVQIEAVYRRLDRHDALFDKFFNHRVVDP